MSETTRRRWSRSIWAAFFASALVVGGALRTAALDAPSTIQIYALDGGNIEMADMGLFSDTGEFDGKTGKLVAPAFLIRHPKGNLLWDTGVGDGLAKTGPVNLPFGVRMSVNKTIEAQLAELGLTPKDIHFVAFSHVHGDHTGNAPLFPNAKFIVSKKELDFARGKPTPGGVDPKLLAGITPAKQISDEFDHDVFGDGRVRVLRAPGHTPDSRVLMVKLQKNGNFIFSGDLYHTREAVKQNLVPSVNFNRAETLASFDRVTKLVKNNNARLVVQHVAEDFAALPKFPAFLD